MAAKPSLRAMSLRSIFRSERCPVLWRRATSFPVSKGYPSSTSTSETLSVIRWFNGSSEPMRHIPRKTWRGSNRFTLDKQATTRVDGRDTRSECFLINKQRKHAIDYRSVRGFLSVLAAGLGVEERGFSVVLIT